MRAHRGPSGVGLGRSFVVVAAAIATLAVVWATPIGKAAAEGSGPYRYLGRLETSPGSTKPGESNKVFFVDTAHRRLYSAYAGVADNDVYFREYDLDTPGVPRYLREGRIGSGEVIGSTVLPGGAYVTYDSRRDRFLFVSNSGAIAGCQGDPFCGAREPAPDKLFVIDRKKLRLEKTWNMTAVGGMLARGITYSPEDDRLYVVGYLPSPGFNPYDLSGDLPRTFPVAVVALDPATGQTLWVRHVPECAIPMEADFAGVTVARSAHRPALYFGCIRTAYVSEVSGLARLWISPEATQVDAPRFALEYFPLSGSYAGTSRISGFGLHDRATDRFFLQSQSVATPGTWVFDGSVSAWVGFVGAPDNTNLYGGLDARTGKYYLEGQGSGWETSYILSVDGRSTPVPQGRLFLPKRGTIHWFILTDPATRRMFVEFERRNDPGVFDWLVYRDEQPIAPAQEPVDYDLLTSGIPEGANTFSTFAGSVNGFGAQVLLVGGAEGIVGTQCAVLPRGTDSPIPGCDSVKELFRQSFNFSPSFADRALFGALVPNVDLRNVGASAEARALSFDQTSDGEYETLVKEVARQVAEDTGNEEAGDAVKEQLFWPHRQAACLDAGEKTPPKDEAGPGGGSSVVCDQGKDRAAASTGFGAFAIAGVEVASTSFRTESVRDATKGILTSTTAVVKGLEISIPGFGTVSIGKMIAVATTGAHGSKGTASARWTRTFDGVTVRDADGAVVFACAEGQPCDQKVAVDAMNDVLKTRVRVDLPKPELVASPGGAFAGVQETESDFINGLVANNEPSRAMPALQVTVFNDGDSKSRLLFQFGAIQASSIYGISSLPSEEPLPGTEPLPLPTGGLALPPPFVVPPPGGLGPPPSGPGVRIGQAALFLVRSPKDALLFGLTILLCGAAIASIWRRRVLVHRLEEL